MALLFPTVGLLVLFKIVPIGNALYGSVHSYDLAGNIDEYVGLSNYSELFGDSQFWDSIQVTVLLFVVKLPVQLALGLASGMLLMQSRRINAFVRSTMFLPTVMPIVVVGLIFTFVFDREVGSLNVVLRAIGFDSVGWLQEPWLARLVILFVSVWRDAGITMLIFLGGLQAVPEDLLNAARIDGANRFQRTWYIVVPLLARTIQFAAVMTTAAAFQVFAPVFVMTRGGPGKSTEVIGYRIFTMAFQNLEWGLANAASVLIMAILSLVTVFELWVLRPRYES